MLDLFDNIETWSYQKLYFILFSWIVLQKKIPKDHPTNIYIYMFILSFVFHLMIVREKNYNYIEQIPPITV